MNNWYKTNMSGEQGLVIEEGTGRNVAVTYEQKDALPISLVPLMIEAVEESLQELEYMKNRHDFPVDPKLISKLWLIKSKLENNEEEYE